MSYIKNLWNKLLLTCYYYDLLLYLDSRRSKVTHLNPNDIAQAIRQYSLTAEGVKAVKNNINTKLVSKNTASYRGYLSKVEDLVPLAEVTEGSKAKTMEFLKSNMDFRNKDIVTDLDKAKMVEKRIQDYKELQNHKKMREELRSRRNNGK